MIDWLIRSSFPLYIQRSWQLRFYRQSEIGEWWLTTEFELDIPSLTQEGIQMNDYVFSKVRELQSISMIDWLLMIEMLILLVDLFYRRVKSYQRIRVFHKSQSQLVFIPILAHWYVVWSTNELIVFVENQSLISHWNHCIQFISSHSVSYTSKVLTTHHWISTPSLHQSTNSLYTSFKHSSYHSSIHHDIISQRWWRQLNL